MQPIEQEWINGKMTLGAAANWSADEIRLVSELGFALAQQGRNSEAISIFEGLIALAPSTVYFESALGALWLRERNYQKALKHLNAALETDDTDIPTRVNRGEAYLQLGDFENAQSDLEYVINSEKSQNEPLIISQCRVRAQALIFATERLSENN